MAIQSQNDLCHWEIVNRSDSDLNFDDDVSVFGVESLDSFSFTCSSSSDDDEKDLDRHDEAMRFRSLEIHDDDDYAMREESLSCYDIISPNNHVVVDDDVMREESQSCGDVIIPSNHVVDDVDEMSDEPRLCDDVSDSKYHVRNLSDVNNHVLGREGKDLSNDDYVMALRSRQRDDVIDPSLQYVYNPCKYQNYDYNDYNNDDDKDDDVEEDYDVDDELVPWGVKDRFERQRSRKLGKRSCVRMMKAKRSALLYTKPGCVRGKHGLGMKAY